jgi:hypothetical protein
MDPAKAPGWSSSTASHLASRPPIVSCVCPDHSNSVCLPVSQNIHPAISQLGRLPVICPTIWLFHPALSFACSTTCQSVSQSIDARRSQLSVRPRHLLVQAKRHERHAVADEELSVIYPQSAGRVRPRPRPPRCAAELTSPSQQALAGRRCML